MKHEKLPPLTSEQQEMVIQNVRLAWKIARAFHKKYPTFELDDLVSEGHTGLIRATQTYDGNRAAFSTYAAWWIKAKIHLYIGENFSAVRIKRPNGVFDKSRFGIHDISLDAPLGDDESLTMGSVLVSDTISPEENADNILRDRLCKSLVQYLKGPKERAIFFDRLYTDDPKTLDELGQKFGVTKERVRQIEAGLLKKLRQRFVVRNDLRELVGA